MMDTYIGDILVKSLKNMRIVPSILINMNKWNELRARTRKKVTIDKQLQRYITN
jgi:hypothetical protein